MYISIVVPLLKWTEGPQLQSNCPVTNQLKMQPNPLQEPLGSSVAHIDAARLSISLINAQVLRKHSSTHVTPSDAVNLQLQV